MPRKSNTKTLEKAGETSKRGIPVQVYFSRDAHVDLIDLAAIEGESVSALIRELVRKSAARRLPQRVKKNPVSEDPRQLRWT